MWFWDKTKQINVVHTERKLRKKGNSGEQNEFLVCANAYIDDFSWFYLIFQEKLFTFIKTILILGNLIVGDN